MGKYIDKALNLFIRLFKRQFLRNQLVKESLLTREDSLAVLAEFERLEGQDEPNGSHPFLSEL